MPGAAYLEMAFAMALEKFACQAVELKNVKLLSLLTLPETQVRSLRLKLFGQRGDGAEFRISSIQDDKSELLLSDGEILVDLLSKAGHPKTGMKLNNNIRLVCVRTGNYFSGFFQTKNYPG